MHHATSFWSQIPLENFLGLILSCIDANLCLQLDIHVQAVCEIYRCASFCSTPKSNALAILRHTVCHINRSVIPLANVQNVFHRLIRRLSDTAFSWRCWRKRRGNFPNFCEHQVIYMKYQFFHEFIYIQTAGVTGSQQFESGNWWSWRVWGVSLRV